MIARIIDSFDEVSLGTKSDEVEVGLKGNFGGKYLGKYSEMGIVPNTPLIKSIYL